MRQHRLASLLVCIALVSSSAAARANVAASTSPTAPGTSTTIEPTAQQNSEGATALDVASGLTIVSIPNDEITGQPIRTSTTKAIVLIHGWNPADVTNMYEASPAWTALVSSLKFALKGSDWALVLYRWEDSASTGPIYDPSDYPWIYPNAAVPAAANGSVLGPSLATALHTGAPNLEQVQFIAHSAGTWVTRSAIQSLLAKNPNVVVQATLLDPFIPDVLELSLPIPLPTTGMNYDAINSLAVDRVAMLENYCANDEFVDPDACDSGLGFPPLKSPGTVATPGGDDACAPFSWRSKDLESFRVDWANVWSPLGPIAGISLWYDCHSGPIQFYADTVNYRNFGLSAPGLSNPSLDLANVGWARSLFYKEKKLRAVVTNMSPAALPASSSPQLVTISGSNFKLAGDPAASSLVFFDAANNDHYVTPFNVTTTSMQCYLTVGTQTGVWTGYVTNGSVASLPFSFSVAASGSALAAPSSLVATAVSPTQVNLAWTSNSSTHDGFEIWRVGPSGTWAKIGTAGKSQTYYTDSTCTAGTTYQFKVRAYRATMTPSAYSNTATSTTSATTTIRTLYLRSVNPSSGVFMQSSIGNTQFAYSTTPTMTGRDGGSQVTVVCPPTLANGQIFQGWLFDGVDYAFTNFTTVLLDRDHTLTAVYGSAPPANRVLSNVTIQGPASLDERSTAQYSAIATYTDGSSGTAPANWSSDSSYGTFSTAGLLDASAVTIDRNVEISATVGYYGVVKTAKKDVTIHNTDVLAPIRRTFFAHAV